MTRRERLERLALVVGWVCFAAGVALVVNEIICLQITGLAVIGVLLLVAWLALIGGFHHDFWIQEDRYAEPWPLDALEQEGHR